MVDGFALRLVPCRDTLLDRRRAFPNFLKGSPISAGCNAKMRVSMPGTVTVVLPLGSQANSRLSRSFV